MHRFTVACPEDQLDLPGDAVVPSGALRVRRVRGTAARSKSAGVLLLAVARIDEYPANPRAHFPQAALDDLAADIRLRGILMPLVVHLADANGRHKLHFGAMRLRAAILAGMRDVPVVVRAAPADRYAQVAENLKRHNLSPLDLARLIRSQMDVGESQTTIARQLDVNLTTVAHHLSPLDLPPVLDGALKAGRCTSPRTLHELSALHDRHPEHVADLLGGLAPVTRESVKTLRARVDSTSATDPARLIGQAMVACVRQEKLLAGIDRRGTFSDHDALQAFQARLAALPRWLVRGSDGQTP